MDSKRNIFATTESRTGADALLILPMKDEEVSFEEVLDWEGVSDKERAFAEVLDRETVSWTASDKERAVSKEEASPLDWEGVSGMASDKQRAVSKEEPSACETASWAVCVLAFSTTLACVKYISPCEFFASLC